MPTLRRALRTVRSATFLSTTRPAYAAGVRASLATVIPLAAGQLLDRAGAATWMSLGGFNGALSDRGGSYHSRASTMGVLMGASAATAVIATLVRGHLAATLVATFIVGF
ncbi:MAG: hypothetical protein M3Z05_09850, partial [Gemmatimonadota bacterium]|nr:hypothetical protein [Gemmatimonadota bacterium]